MSLKGRIPRALRNHRTPEGYRYGEYLRAKLRKLGPLDAEARPWIRECGVIMLALEALHREEQDARALLTAPGVGARRRARVRIALGRFERRGMRLRAGLALVEQRLEQLASRNGHAAADPLDAVRQAVAEANRP